MNNLSLNKIKKGSVQVVFSNVLSIITNIFKTLIIPIIISSIKMYSFWQIYLFYLSYILIVSLGYNDGFYIKYTGSNILDEDEDKTIRSSMIVQMLFTALIFIVSLFIVILLPLGNKKTIYILLMFNIIPMEFIDLCLKTFQSSFEMKKYSIFNIVDKFLFLLLIIAIIPFGKVDCYILIIVDLVVKLIVCFLLTISLKKYWIFNNFSIKKGFTEWKKNVKIGKYIIVSSYLLILITGIGRIAIEWIGSIKEYAFYSLAMSISNIINLIIGSVGLVLFPLYKSVDSKKSNEYSTNISQFLLLLTPLVLLCYFPFALVINLFLIKYVGTIYYLSFIIPLTILKSFSSLIFIPLMKKERKEKSLFVNNGISILLYLIIFIPLYVITKDIFFILVGTIAITFLELLLNCISLKQPKHDIIIVIVLTILFVITLNTINIYVCLIVLIVALLIIYINNREMYNLLFKKLFKLLFSK